MDDATVAAIESHLRTGRPLGDDAFVGASRPGSGGP